MEREGTQGTRWGFPQNFQSDLGSVKWKDVWLEITDGPQIGYVLRVFFEIWNGPQLGEFGGVLVGNWDSDVLGPSYGGLVRR